ncbi:MAG TPA: hypothetical protein RMH99_23200 [Sandaracinaceae bacterium LLY-WYZ-13_1]|nr:hypothetical protein [Sandaracinaceae bacterium LLY-WYZ-13_1]
MRSSLFTLACLACLTAATGCDGEPMADAGPDAAVDAGTDASVDAGTDAGPPPSAFCRPCRRDADCGPDNLCLVLADGERACGHPCEGDADCADLSLEATCVQEADWLPMACRPTADTCVVNAPGEPCPDDGCAGTYETCAELDGASPFCTVECAVDADCPIGMRRCRETAAGRVCVPDEAAPPERCAALVDAGRATRCEADGACPGGGTCHGAGELRLCLEAPSGGECPEGTARWAADGGDVCVPTGPAFGDPWSERVAPDCHCVLADEGAMLDEALDVIDRDRCAMMFPHEILDRFIPELSHDRFRLSWTDRVHSYWPASLAFGRHVADRLDAAADGGRPATDALREAAAWADLAGDPTEVSASSDLAAALAALVTEAGGTPDDAALAAAADGLEADLRGRLVPVIDALRAAVAARREAVAVLSEEERATFFDGASTLFLGGTPRLAADDAAVQGALLGDVDVGAMARAATALTEAIEAAGLTAHAGDDATLTVDTPAGRVAVRGGGDDTYEGDEWDGALLLIELGGDDTYRTSAGATSSPGHGVSVLVDVDGADTYAYEEVPVDLDEGPSGHRRLPSDGAGRLEPVEGRNGPQSRSMVSRQGAGRLGIGLLLDLGAQADRYRSLRMSQGYGALGVGLLYDAAGDDAYEGEAAVQGAASFGVGLLVDGDGGDEYVAYHDAQGFAYSRAVGALYDGAGDDVYLGHPDDVLYVSPQDGGFNSSFVQGAGFGRRADFLPDGVFMSGGLGVLRDRAGADRYTAGIFAQATGFWYGTGMLLEGAGDDVYDGVWYVQSGDAHFATSVLLEDGGSDDFNPSATRRNVMMGGGHDFSGAWFVDRAGDDTYRGTGISFGAGNEAGAGLFADLGGTDGYDADRDNNLGHGALARPDEDALRRASGTVGIFLEADGTDTYTRPTVGDVANDATWEQARHGRDAGELGVGLDRTDGRTGLE